MMWAPAFYDQWTSASGSEYIHSFAIVTREPPIEIERLGHDRCPVFPKWHHVDSYLDTMTPRETFKDMFRDLTPVVYDHIWMS